jgi:hypothetical protein
MIDRIKGRIAFICDECQDGLETEEFVFDDAVEEAKLAGWMNVHIDNLPYNGPKLKPGQKFANICKDCYGEYKEA